MECRRAKEVQHSVNSWWKIFDVAGNNLDGLLIKTTDNSSNNCKVKIVRDVVLHAYLWALWKSRNGVNVSSLTVLPFILV